MYHNKKVCLGSYWITPKPLNMKPLISTAAASCFVLLLFSCKHEIAQKEPPEPECPRLTDYIGYYPPANGASEFWTKFYYDANGGVFKDSSFHYGMYGPEISGNIYAPSICLYEYDSVGRINPECRLRRQNKCTPDKPCMDVP